MIAGAVRGAGGPRLPRHLENESGNESIFAGPVRGLVSDITDGQALMRELERLQSHARTTRPIHHVHADAPVGLTPDREEVVRARFWAVYEAEFGLEAAPFYSRIHVKHGRSHEHRVYGLGRTDGSVIDMSFDMPRREKVCRRVEIECGLPLVPGAHSRAVVAAFEREGRHDFAAAMRLAGLHDIERPRASITPRQRAQQERTGVSRSALAAFVREAWLEALDGIGFAATLTRSGLHLARGRDCLVILDKSGNVHALCSLLAAGARSAGRAASTAAEVSQGFAETDIPDLEEAKTRRMQQASEARVPAPSLRADHRGRAVVGARRVPTSVVHERRPRRHVSPGFPGVVVPTEAAIARRLAGILASGPEQASRQRQRLARPTAASIETPAFETIAIARLEAAVARSERLLSLQPHADPASRDPRVVESGLREQALARETEARRTAELARDHAALARVNLGAGDRLMAAIRLRTDAAAALARLAREAVRLTVVAETESAFAARAIQGARQLASSICAERSRKRRAWWSRPEIALAAEELRLDQRALRAVRAGDAALARAIATGGIHTARQLVRHHDETVFARSEQARGSIPEPGHLLRSQGGIGTTGTRHDKFRSGRSVSMKIGGMYDA